MRCNYKNGVIPFAIEDPNGYLLSFGSPLSSPHKAQTQP
jgi:hypothetical protein